MTERMRSRGEVAEFLAVPPKTLAAWASRGEGPKFYRIGRHARYRLEDVEAWLAEQVAQGPAHEYGRRPLRAVRP
jgi:excisionase family DNA binding protein